MRSWFSPSNQTSPRPVTHTEERAEAALPLPSLALAISSTLPASRKAAAAPGTTREVATQISEAGEAPYGLPNRKSISGRRGRGFCARGKSLTGFETGAAVGFRVMKPPCGWSLSTATNSVR